MTVNGFGVWGGSPCRLSIVFPFLTLRTFPEWVAGFSEPVAETPGDPEFTCPALPKQTAYSPRKTTVESQHRKQICTRAEGWRGWHTHYMLIYIYRAGYDSHKEAGKTTMKTEPKVLLAVENLRIRMNTSWYHLVTVWNKRERRRSWRWLSDWRSRSMCIITALWSHTFEWPVDVWMSGWNSLLPFTK